MFGNNDDEGHLRTDAMIEGMNKMNYTAQNIALKEIYSSVGYFEKMKSKSNFPYISANWVYKDTGKPIAEPYIIKEYYSSSFLGIKTSTKSIGFIGLNRKNSGASFKTKDGREIVVEDPQTAARRLIPELRRKCEIVVALARMDLNEATTLIDNVPGIDVLLISYGARTSRKVEKRGSTFYAFTGKQGKWLGELRLYLDKEMEKIRKASLSMHFLGEDQTDDKDQKVIQDNYMLRLKKLKKEQVGNSDENVKKISNTFATSEACKKCHSKEYAIWKETPHATAFNSLEKNKQHFNKACIGCHSLGYNRPDGFMNNETTPTLTNVQCENCHGPLSEHVSKPGLKPRADATGCKKCHNTKQSPNFNYEKYWEKIKH